MWQELQEVILSKVCMRNSWKLSAAFSGRRFDLKKKEDVESSDPPVLVPLRSINGSQLCSGFKPQTTTCFFYFEAYFFEMRRTAGKQARRFVSPSPPETRCEEEDQSKPTKTNSFILIFTPRFTACSRKTFCLSNFYKNFDSF